jgi:hypothetical protein
MLLGFFVFGEGGVPGTIPLICSWHRTKKLFLAQNEEIVPGTERRNCSWHRAKKLFLAQNEEVVPGTERRKTKERRQNIQKSQDPPRY